MSDTNRQIVTKYEYINLIDFIKPTVKQTAEYLETLEEEGWGEIKFDPEDPECISLLQHRLETDEEYNRRITWEKDAEDRAKKHKVQGRERRYRDYLKLKEEFGNE
jgi:hypothetical protein